MVVQETWVQRVWGCTMLYAVSQGRTVGIFLQTTGVMDGPMTNPPYHFNSFARFLLSELPVEPGQISKPCCSLGPKESKQMFKASCPFLN